MSNSVIELLQEYLPSIHFLHEVIHPWMAPLKWIGAPLLATIAIYRAAYGKDGERFAFVSVAAGCFTCFTANLLSYRGIVVSGDALDVKLSTLSSVLFAAFPILLALRGVLDHKHAFSLVKETWGVAAALVSAGGAIALSIEASRSMDEVLSTAAMAMAGAGFAAWALQHGLSRMIAMSIFVSMMVVPQLTYYANDLIMADMMRFGTLGVAILLASVDDWSTQKSQPPATPLAA